MSNPHILLHPVAVVFRHLTSIVSHMLPDPVETSSNCDCCGRPAADFEFKGYQGKNGYGVSYLHCNACESFNVGDVDVLGIDKNLKILPDGTKTGVSHKFGMFAGSGCIVDSAGKVVFFAPPGSYKKLPESFLEKFEVIQCTTGGQMMHLQAMDLSYPIIYIQDFGKKTKSLITGLRYSSSKNHIVICTDDGNTSFNQEHNTVDLSNILKLVSEVSGLKRSAWKEFRRQISLLSYGGSSPEDFTKYMSKQEPQVLTIYRLLPIDPHQRISMLRLVESMI